ncbi:hypothetical protein ABQF33_03050 [Mycolicibacterium sp. XJ2]
MSAKPQSLAEKNTHLDKLEMRAGKSAYRPFVTLLCEDYSYNDALQIRRKSHVLPLSHRLFRILSPRQLIALEVVGAPPLDRLPCCDALYPRLPVGDTVADLRYVPDFARVHGHYAAHIERLVREHSLGCPCADHEPLPYHCIHEYRLGRARNRERKKLRRHVRDTDDWGSTTEEIPLLGINLRRTD